MTDYQHVGVASDFSPTFTSVLAEAKSFARHCGADLEIQTSCPACFASSSFNTLCLPNFSPHSLVTLWFVS